jgi:hypothetical protein
VGVGDLATLLALCLYALLPVLPKLFLAAAGAALVLACLREIPGDGTFSRAARAIVGTLSLYAALAGHWYIWPAYLLGPLVVAALLGYLARFKQDFLTAARPGSLGQPEWVAIGLVGIIAAIALVGWVTLLQPDLSR